MGVERVYQYISMNQDVLKILQLVKKTANTNISPILDIEDSLEIPFNPQKTYELKSQARKKLEVLINLIHEQGLDSRLNIRINASDTEHLQLDVLLLSSLTPKIKWSAIVLPKVNNSDILQKYVMSLSEIAYDELIVTAETNEFFNNSTKVLDKCEQLGVSKIQFGHWDYFLSIQDFPIPLPDDSRLWDQVKVLIGLLNKRGFLYIHSPFCHLLDHNQFRAMTDYLVSLTDQPVAVAALTFSQGLQLAKKNKASFLFQSKKYNFSEEEKQDIAKTIIAFFEEKLEAKFSFNITRKKCRFIAPHEYLAAVKYLQSCKNHQ